MIGAARRGLLPAAGAGKETDVSHGVVEVFAYQETLLIMAVFGVALLTMIWVGFSRWLRQKERMDRLIADRTAERTAQLIGQIERVEARLNAIEQTGPEAGPEAALDFTRNAGS